MKNQIPQFNFIFFSTLFAILIWMASPSVKGFAEEPTAPTFPLREYRASYQISWHGMDAGISHHKLVRLPSGAFHVETRTEPKVAMLPFRYTESSDFDWNEGKIIPLNYAYDIHEGKKRKKGLLTFNWTDKTVHNKTLAEPWDAPLADGVQSKLTQTLCLRQALLSNQTLRQFTVAESDKFKDYDFTVVGTEYLNTKLGKLETIKMEHRSRKGFHTTLWLAKAYDYTPVKMVQYRNGKIAAQGEILKYEAGS